MSLKSKGFGIGLIVFSFILIWAFFNIYVVYIQIPVILLSIICLVTGIRLLLERTE